MESHVKSVGFIGLGNIGKPIAINVVKAGFDLVVYDLRPEPIQKLTAAGAKAARSAPRSPGARRNHQACGGR